jgi:hypothetical protein
MSQRRRKAAADMGCDIFFDWDSARSVSGKAEREVIGKPDLMGVKNAINHPPNDHFCWYKPFPVMGGLWHCFTHINGIIMG